MTPEEIAERIVQSIPDWYPSEDSHRALFNALVFTIRDAYERAAQVAEKYIGTFGYDNPAGSSDFAELAAAIRALKGER